MAQPEVRNIVVLGAGFAGLSASHYFMRHVYPAVKADKKYDYRLHLIDQSTHFWWHLTAPRTMVKPELLPHSKTFVAIKDGFNHYGTNKDVITFHQAQPASVDLAARTVTLQSVGDKSSTQTIAYYALVIATGTQTPTPLTSIHDNHLNSIAALDDMSKRLSTAKTVVIGGAGPIGVETAGEIGEIINGPNNGWFAPAKPTNPKVRITLVCGADRLVEVLRPSLAEKAGKMLERVGAEVLYKTRVSKVEGSADGQTTVHLDNGKTLTADVYIPATGVTPNTSFLPDSILNEKKYVHVNPSTLRVENAGERVYAFGDVGDFTRGGVLECKAAAPVFGGNFARDLGVSSAPAEDRKFVGDSGETQVVPVGSRGGVGAFKGYALPSFGVRMLKGKDFFLRTIADFSEGNGVAKA